MYHHSSRYSHRMGLVYHITYIRNLVRCDGGANTNCLHEDGRPMVRESLMTVLLPCMTNLVSIVKGISQLCWLVYHIAAAKEGFGSTTSIMKIMSDTLVNELDYNRPHLM
jgi:hypothetical protein